MCGVSYQNKLNERELKKSGQQPSLATILARCKDEKTLIVYHCEIYNKKVVLKISNLPLVKST
jgi:asparagine synthetase B (glutamine-hydrolysing)